MQERIDAELALIRQRFHDAEYHEQGHWVRIPSYPLPEGWNRSSTEVVFQIPVDRGYPARHPYGIYVPAGLQFQVAGPDNYKDRAPTQPPFPGTWGIFSWQPADGQWRPTADIRKGSNLLNWVVGFADRFQEGK
jgi:hypothetical protein